MSHLAYLICAPMWAITAVFIVALVRITSAPLFSRTWAENTGVVVTLAFTAAGLTETILIAVWA